ncbi:large conductance mechanosensitive channel protein MscL [Trueperella pecoris]|uniref:Large-conductance mechanosensitive channel n=1 Tax=Trueperella pecoris TaxID=2733571 RepID=A0A7M1QZ49_9ACTO|nr:large conductance mechanosensitive channel protein MscL [Trueperella pecoris]QOQ38257.1 large conductance mechanosensitive channel protein MscL [Trueperella pecoris]QOR47300.1 large conductance mechanosensitive channel protein MscL [Trueperella pecoris]QTG75158.1 large conductance mechanosensitive channel protein MscL [Trueperella pecoris]
MLKGFKEFISRGNVLDLAVGVIIAGAFSAIVTALNEKLLMPLIGAIFGKPNFDQIWTIHLNGATILPGAVITQAVNFLIVAAAIYFFIVVPMNKIIKKPQTTEEAPVKTDEAILLEEIRDLLARQN